MTIGNNAWSRASFRISSNASSDQLIEETIQVLDASRFQKVRIRNNPAENPGMEECRWILDSGLSRSKPLQDHFDALLSFVDSNTEELLRLKDQCSFDIFCGFSSGSGQGGFGIPSSSLRRMGELNIDLILDLYPPTDDEMGGTES